MEIILHREDLNRAASKYHPRYIEETDFNVPYEYITMASKVTFIDDDGEVLHLKNREVKKWVSGEKYKIFLHNGNYFEALYIRKNWFQLVNEDFPRSFFISSESIKKVEEI